MEIKIDIQKGLDLHNAGKPEEQHLSKQDLIEKLDAKGVKITEETIRNYKNGKVPKGFKILFEVMEITGTDIEDILTKTKTK